VVLSPVIGFGATFALQVAGTFFPVFGALPGWGTQDAFTILAMAASVAAVVRC
jgi:hypothetical protein